MIGQTRARPVRVAFLVEENENWKEMLLAIFTNCYSRWGGRFNIIVPCKDGRPYPSFEPWLDAYDPDIIYSYVQLDDSTMQDMQERFDPARLEMHQLCQGSGWVDFGPNHSVCGLSSLSTLLGERDEVSRFESDMGSFLDKDWGVEFPFLDYNFGTHRYCFREAPDRNSTQWKNFYKLTPENEPRINDDPRIRYLGNTLDGMNSYTRLHKYYDNRHPSILSAWRSPRAELQIENLKKVFLLTVGERFEDYLMFWNTRSHIPRRYDGDLVSLIVSKQDLADDNLRECVTELLANHNHIRESEDSRGSVCVLSTSESEGALRRITYNVSAGNTNSICYIKVFDGIDNLAAKLIPRRYPTHDISYDDWGNPVGWTEFSYSGRSFKAPSIEPQYFRGFSTLSRYMYRGVWVQDIDMQKEEDRWKHPTVAESWMFPKRLCFAKHLLPNIGVRSINFLYSPRSNSQGRISVFTRLNEQLPTVRLLDEGTLIRRAIFSPIFVNKYSAIAVAPHRKIAENAWLSDKGRYLTALLNLAGGQGQATKIFLNPFWRKRFDELGVENLRSEEQRDAIVNIIRKHFSRVQENDEKSVDIVANKILQQVQKQEKQLYGMNHHRMKEAYGEFIKNRYSQELSVDQEEDEMNDLNRSIEYLVGRKILHPGLEWRCDECSRKNWVSLNDVKTTNVCEVCQSSQTISIPIEGRYVLNDFLKRGLRHHGLLACVWCLAYLRKIAEHSFSFCCSLQLSKSQNRGEASGTDMQSDSVDREIDLIALVDGKLYLCEVKSSTGWVNSEDWEKIIDNAKLIRPDVALMAVMAKQNRSLLKEFNSTKEKLMSENIDVKLYTESQSEEDPLSSALPNG